MENPNQFLTLPRATRSCGVRALPTGRFTRPKRNSINPQDSAYDCGTRRAPITRGSVMRFLRVLISLIPVGFLPNGTKVIDGKRVPLSPTELRQNFERTVNHHMQRFLDTYSPVRRLIRAFKRIRLNKVQREFFEVIGQITLTHAGIEQDLKNTLIDDWGLGKECRHGKKNVNLEHLYGKRLRCLFINKLEDMLIPEKYLNQYTSLRDEFRKLSDKRNEALKANYAFNRDTATISRIQEKEQRKFDTKSSHEEMFNAWMPCVGIAELEGLLSDLQVLRREFMKQRIEVKKDKSKLIIELCSEPGKSYPAYAFTNPYRYQNSLTITE